jgi:hypothetical protein
MLRDAYRRVRVAALAVDVNARLARELGRRRMLAEAHGLIGERDEG